MNCCSNKTKDRSIEEKKSYTTRINKIIGQLNGIKKMIDEDIAQLKINKNSKSYFDYLVEINHPFVKDYLYLKAQLPAMNVIEILTSFQLFAVLL